MVSVDSTRRALAIAVVLATGAGLAGCAGSPYPIFDTQRTAADTLPRDFDRFDDGQFAEFDLSTVRFAARDDKTELYLLKTKQGALCLAVAAGVNSVIACSGKGPLATQGPAGSYEVAPAPIAEKPGWTKLSENIRVEDGS